MEDSSSPQPQATELWWRELPRCRWCHKVCYETQQQAQQAARELKAISPERPLREYRSRHKAWQSRQRVWHLTGQSKAERHERHYKQRKLRHLRWALGVYLTIRRLQETVGPEALAHMKQRSGKGSSSGSVSSLQRAQNARPREHLALLGIAAEPVLERFPLAGDRLFECHDDDPLSPGRSPYLKPHVSRRKQSRW